MIQEKGIASDIYGQTILSAALLVDFFAMIAISALAGIVVSGSAQGALGSLALVAIAVRSEEHTSELQSLMRISYAVFCLKKKNTQKLNITTHTIYTPTKINHT